jgi:hypothetical protein
MREIISSEESTWINTLLQTIKNHEKSLSILVAVQPMATGQKAAEGLAAGSQTVIQKIEWADLSEPGFDLHIGNLKSSFFLHLREFKEAPEIIIKLYSKINIFNPLVEEMPTPIEQWKVIGVARQETIAIDVIHQHIVYYIKLHGVTEMSFGQIMTQLSSFEDYKRVFEMAKLKQFPNIKIEIEDKYTEQLQQLQKAKESGEIKGEIQII